MSEGTRRIIKEKKLLSTLPEKILIIKTYRRYIKGESAIPAPPRASIKKPAQIAVTAALAGLSSRAMARSIPIMRSGVAGHILSVGKNAHCAHPSINTEIPYMIILLRVLTPKRDFFASLFISVISLVSADHKNVRNARRIPKIYRGSNRGGKLTRYLVDIYIADTADKKTCRVKSRISS